MWNPDPIHPEVAGAGGSLEPLWPEPPMDGEEVLPMSLVLRNRAAAAALPPPLPATPEPRLDAQAPAATPALLHRLSQLAGAPIRIDLAPAGSRTPVEQMEHALEHLEERLAPPKAVMPSTLGLLDRLRQARGKAEESVKPKLELPPLLFSPKKLAAPAAEEIAPEPVVPEAQPAAEAEIAPKIEAELPLLAQPESLDWTALDLEPPLPVFAGGSAWHAPGAWSAAPAPQISTALTPGLPLDDSPGRHLQSLFAAIDAEIAAEGISASPVPLPGFGGLDPGRDARQAAEAGHHVVLQAAGHCYCLPVAHVLAIGAVPPLGPMTDGPGSVRGVLNRQGKRVPVLDLRGLLDLPSGNAGEDRRLLVLTPGGGVATAALIVDRVLGLDRCGNQTLPLLDVAQLLTPFA